MASVLFEVNLNWLCCVRPLFLQGVHAGSITAEGESGSLETNSVDCRKNSRSVPQKKRHGPLKHSGSPRKKAEQESRPRVKPTGWTCGECLQWFPERDSYVSHVKTTHRKVSRRDPIPKQRNGRIGGSSGTFFHCTVFTVHCPTWSLPGRFL